MATILYTTDAGITWNYGTPGTNNYLSSVCFVDIHTFVDGYYWPKWLAEDDTVGIA